MLILKAPIEIAARTEYVNNYEDFGRRIGAGYSLMNSHIEEGDLLHIMNTPPEIFIAEEGMMTSTLNQVSTSNNNYEKVEIINNLLNRIVMSADVDLTYQDRVFITDALYKLGIRDDRMFMSRVYELINENRVKNSVINTYFNEGSFSENVRQMITELIDNSSRTESRENYENIENTLYDQIFNRLQTGAVYQIVSNFNHTTEANEISADEYALSEQNILASNMLVEQIANYMSLPNTELIYNYNNSYEEEIVNGDIRVNNEENAVTSAVFLDIVRNLYTLAHDKPGSVNNSYFDFRSMIYKASDNSVMRLKNVLNSSVVNQRTVNNLTNNNYTEEAGARIEYKVNTEITDNSYYDSESTTYNSEESTISRIRNEVLESLVKEGDITTNADNRRHEEIILDHGDNIRIDNSENIEAITNIIEENIDRRTQYEQRVQNTQNQTSSTTTEENINLQESSTQEFVNLTENNVENEENNDLLQILNRINIENEERRQQYTTLIQNIEKRHRKPKKRNGMKETMRDAIVALNDGKQIMEKLSEEEEQAKEEEREIRREIERIFPDNTRRIFEIVSEYYENHGDTFVGNTESNISLLINNIEQVRRENEEIKQQNINITQADHESIETVHRILESENAAVRPESRTEKADIPEASIVHRQTERVTNEDIQETLNEYRRNISRQIQKEIREETENIHTTQTNRVVNNYTTTNQEIELPDIRKMVQDGVNAQLSTISDKVYSRLEKKMANEKSRRGY